MQWQGARGERSARSQVLGTRQSEDERCNASPPGRRKEALFQERAEARGALDAGVCISACLCKEEGKKRVL